jgi:hypothetical protein
MKKKICFAFAVIAVVGALGTLHGCGKSDGVAPGTAVIYGGTS